MASTFTASTSTIVGNKRVVTGTLTGDATYTTAVGGTLPSPSVFGLASLDHIQVGLATAGSHVASFIPATKKVIVFTALTPTEAGTGDLSAILFPVTVWGN